MDITNEECLLCHAEPDVVDMAEVNPREGLLVTESDLSHSVHADFDCVFCHEGIDDIPHAPELPRADPEVCSGCHPDTYDEYQRSAHGTALQAGDPHAPGCTNCHGTHDIHPADDPESKVYPLVLAETCGACHGDEQFALEHAVEVPDAYQTYVSGVHGRGLLRAGLLISASCVDCHGSHDILPESDPDSMVFPLNLSETCGTCHRGLLEEFSESIHGQLLSEGSTDVPTCSTCHNTHGIAPAAVDTFVTAAVAECGTCHAEMLSSYTGTYHGKVTAMGFTGVAACSSCHTAHHILPADDPRSSVNPDNLLATCAGCHEGATENFAGYIVHADPTDSENYPLLFVVYFGMMGLLTMTIIGGTVHTVLWYRRSTLERRERGLSYERPAHRNPMGEPEYVRFNVFNRLLHALVMSSFLILVATGLPVRFAEAPWARNAARLFGGFRGASFLHKTGAIIIFTYVFLHLGYLLYLKLVKKEKGLIFSRQSLLPNYRDWVELKANVKWFLGRGPRPEFGRWTYWEKFDYFADAWGVFVFGTTGLLMWYPVFFTRWLPGWTINVAVILHGFEALLALSFIFTVHFFSAHLRPGKFPLDPVFLTGRITLDELQEERTREYRDLVDRGMLDESLVEPSSDLVRHYSRLIGYTATFLGLLLLFVVATTALWILLT
jgi:cytochrome b subunit of formate dehydrogenase